MNTKSLTILGIITLVIVISAIQLTNKDTVPEKQKLLPELMSTLNDITTIEVATATDKFTLARDKEQWILPEKHNYPADVSKIRQVLVGAAELTILEAKTAKPEWYEKIGVVDVTEKNSTATLLTLKKQNETLASILVGNHEVAKIGGHDEDIYVRKAGDAQSWLVIGNLPVDKTAMSWLNKSIINVDAERMHEVVVTHNNGEKLRIFRETEENQDYQLADIPENMTLSSPDLLKQMATFLSNLDMDDVTVSDEVNFDEKTSTQAVFKTFDGLEVTVIIQEKDGKQYAKLTAMAGESVVKPQPVESKPVEPKPEDKVKIEPAKTESVDKTAQVKMEVANLNQQLAQWVYVLPSYKADNILKKREDLFTEIKEEGDLSDLVDTNTDFPKGLVDLLKPPSEVAPALGNPTTPFEVVPALGNSTTTP